MTIIAKIKTEIERRKKALHSTLFNDEYNDFLSFLSTLESEKPMNLDEEINRYLREECSDDDEPSISDIARHFAEWGAEHAKEQMMKEAVCYIAQADITATGNILIPFIRIGYTALSRYGIKVGDKVKIIIIKEG